MSKYKCLECLDCRELLYGWSVNDQCPNCGGELRKINLDNKKCPDEGNIEKQKDNSKLLNEIRKTLPG